MQQSDDIKTILYGPKTGKTLLRSYPDLEKEPALKGLSNEDILFAWHMGIPGSPVDELWPDNVRYKTSASKCITSSPEKKEAYSNSIVPEEVKLAIRVFSKFSPEARSLAKKMAQTAFMKLQEMVEVNVKEDFIYVDKDGNKLIDWSGRKSYVDSVHKMTETIPILLKQLEEGFGITESKKNEDMMGTKTINKFHQNKKDKSS